MSRLIRAFVLSFLVFVGASPGVLAQAIVEGTVTEGATGDPLPGVSVVVPSLNLGSVTNAEGMYIITGVPAGEHIVEARFVGFEVSREQVAVADEESSSLDFELVERTMGLDEIVVTGAGGPVEKRKMGNTIGTIDAEAMENAPIENFSDVLQGREPGVKGLPSSGITGEGSRIRIRGSASISQSNEPLVYIDGVRVNNGGGGFNDGSSPSRLDDINPESIERVEILKGAAAATLYGTQASNGVIQIFTKNGRAQDPAFSFSAQQGFIDMPNSIPDQVGFTASPAIADTMSNIFGYPVQPYQLVSENFTDDLLETGHNHAYSSGVTGGTAGITYNLNARWSKENGPFTGNNVALPAGASSLADDILRKAQFSASMNIFPTDALQLRVSTNYADTHYEIFQAGNNINSPWSRAIFGLPENVRSNNLNGSRVGVTVAEGLQQRTVQDVRHFTASFGTNYRPLQNLIFDATFGLDYTSQLDMFARPYGWNINNYVTSDVEGSRRTGNTDDLQTTADVKVTMMNDLSDRIESTLIGGAQGFITRATVREANVARFPGPGYDVTGAASEQSTLEFFEEVVNAGVFLQEQIGFDDYIFATVGGRYDVNSAFGSDFSGVFYPKVSLSVVPSDAPFWQPSDLVSSLRLRAAVGQSGLQPGAFDALTTYGSIAAPSGPGIVPQNLGNPELKPEISTEWEVGADAGFFGNRLSAEATYWDRTVRDALVPRQFPVSGGFLATQLDNIGELKGRGVELGLEGMLLETSDVQLDLFANASYLWEQVTDLGGAPPVKAGYYRYRNFVQEGYAPGAFFGPVVVDAGEGRYPVDTNGDGRPDSEQELRGYLDTLTPATADIAEFAGFTMLQDADGDGDQLDHYLGKPQPDWQGSFGLDLSYKNFRLSTMFEYQTGNVYVHNLMGGFRQSSAYQNTMESRRTERDFITGGVDDDYQPLNDTDVRLQAADKWVNEILSMAPYSGLNVIDRADFLRWRELSLTYTLPESLVQSMRSRRASLTVAARNLWISTLYSGVDPEQNVSGRGASGSNNIENNFLSGVEHTNMPLPLRVQISLRVGL